MLNTKVSTVLGEAVSPPELVEDKPVPQLRLIQDGLEVFPQIGIKLVSHLIII